MGEVRIVEAEAWLCRLSLPWPVRLGQMCYPTRDYVVLKLSSDSGHAGWAMGYTRGTPLIEGTQALAGSMPRSIDGPSGLHHVWRRQFAPGWAALVRSASLFDICAWDLVAKQRGQPLGALLGGEPVPVPLMAVAGYFIDDRGAGAVIDEAVRFAEEKFAVVKIMLPGQDLAADQQLLSAIRRAVPPECSVAVDLHGMFLTMEESVEYATWLNDADVYFIEDPFPSAEWREVAAFQAGASVPIASGEDLTGLGGFLDLLNGGVQRIRLDATVSGGVTGALSVLAAASDRPVGVMPHVWPHLHAHLAAVSGQIPFVEVIPDYVGAEPMWSLLAEGPSYRDGRWLATGAAGTGMSVDVAAVERHAVGHWRVAVKTEIADGLYPTSAKEGK
jgi:D-arabinonate dehydratase